MDYIEEYIKFCFDCNYKNVIEHALFSKAVVKTANKHIAAECDRLQLHHVIPKSCGLRKHEYVYGLSLLVLTATEHQIAHDLLSKALIQRRMTSNGWMKCLTIPDSKQNRRLYCSQEFSHKCRFKSYFNIAIDRFHVRRIIAGVVH